MLAACRLAGLSALEASVSSRISGLRVNLSKGGASLSPSTAATNRRIGTTGRRAAPYRRNGTTVTAAS
jgi:hypothetical protein